MYCDYSNWHDFINDIRVRKLILFGAGKLARKFILSYMPEHKIEFIVDNNPELSGTFLYNVPIYYIEKLKEYSPDDFVVLICGPRNEMIPQLSSFNVYRYYDFALIEKNKYFVNEDLNQKYQPKYSFDYSWIDKVNSCYAHALGTIDNIMYTNSLEAFKHNYDKGFRAFEADVFRIEDGTLLLSHNINSIVTIDNKCRHYQKNIYNALVKGRPYSFIQYEKERVFGKYTPLTTKSFIQILNEYSDLYWVTHTHHNFSKDIYSIYSQLVHEAFEIDKNILDRFIIQVYDEYMLDIVMSIYPFKCVNLLQYFRNYNLQPYNNNVDTCLRTGIKIITLPLERINKEVIEYFNQYDINVCAYFEIFDENDIVKYKNMGAKIFCVDMYNPKQ